MDQLEEKLRKIVMTGIGAIVETVEKSKDALAELAGSEQVKNLANKGEKAVQSAVDAGAQAVNRVKSALSEAELNDKIRREKERLKNLAQQVSDLTRDQMEVFETLLKQIKEKPAEMSYGPVEGKDPPSEEALGKPGVTESAFVPKPGDTGKAKKPEHFSPTAPDDEHNIRRLQTNTMNEHLKQNVPPDF